MKFETITVVNQQGMMISILKDMAERYNLYPFQRVSDNLERELIIENCKQGIAECQLEIAMREEFDYEL